jgi:DNA replication and repair protein RecF
MVLRTIEFQGFRNLIDNRLDFSDTFNLIVGDNGAGKTNLLEAIFFAGFASSFRAKDERSLIRLNDDFLRVTAESSEKNANIFFNGEKRLTLQGNIIKGLNEFIGWLPVTVLSLEDIWIIRGAPAKRRSFLDWLITKLNPSYMVSLTEYRKVLRQRNRVLQTVRHDGNYRLLEVYDEQLAGYGNEIYMEREKNLPALRDKVTRLAQELGLMELTVNYLATCPDLRMNAELLLRARDQELKWGETVIGPHRDDLSFLTAGRPLRDYASEGEERSAAIALKLAEVEMLSERTGTLPVLLLDEAIAEFDRERRQTFFQMLRGQIFYSSTQPPDFPTPASGAVFKVQRGQIEIPGKN